VVLISCDNCATVLDAEKLPFAADCRAIDDFGNVREDLFVFEEGDYVAFAPCPACAGQLLKPGSLK
jgi:hypothetical protein